jgi:hypothetical protein
MSVHLFISAGRGPQECTWALAMLLRRLEADATTRRPGAISSPPAGASTTSWSAATPPASSALDAWKVGSPVTAGRLAG